MSGMTICQYFLRFRSANSVVGAKETVKRYEERTLSAKNFVLLMTPILLCKYVPPAIRAGAVKATLRNFSEANIDLNGWKNLPSAL